LPIVAKDVENKALAKLIINNLCGGVKVHLGKKVHCCNFVEDLTFVKVNNTRYQGIRFSKFYTVAIVMRVLDLLAK
jgi:hypothetical protein